MSRKIRCPVASSLDIVGDRWTLQVVRELLRGHTRFSELRETVEGIPPSVLSQRLKTLERAGIVTRRPYSYHPPRSAYFLTPKGHGLGLVVGALSSWGEKYGEHDLSLVDNECGHGVSVVYHCETCGRGAPRSRVRMVGT
ncbi:MAG: winged helix-turn-helix transcriptional regulator [Tepidiformaceae bacterium]